MAQKKKFVRNNRTKWIFGGILIIIVIVGIFLVNPELQQGLLRFNLTSRVKQYSNVRGVQYCRFANDVEIRRVSMGMIGRLAYQPGEKTIAQFTIAPRNCTLSLQNFNLQWVNERRSSRDYDEPVHINILDPKIEVQMQASSAEFPFIFTGQRYVCMEGSDAESIILSSKDPSVIPTGESATVTVKGTLFAQKNVNPDNTVNGQAKYALKLTGIGNVSKAYDFPVISIAGNSPVNDFYVNFCAMLE